MAYFGAGAVVLVILFGFILARCMGWAAEADAHGVVIADPDGEPIPGTFVDGGTFDAQGFAWGRAEYELGVSRTQLLDDGFLCVTARLEV